MGRPESSLLGAMFRTISECQIGIDMVKIRASCLMFGPEFSPRKFEELSGVRLVRSNEPGSMGGQGGPGSDPAAYGSGSIEVSSEAEVNWRRLDELLVVVKACVGHARACGAERISLECSLFHDGQCNFGLSPAQLKLMGDLGIPVAISCYRRGAKVGRSKSG
jgi:hypothetical protein